MQKKNDSFKFTVDKASYKARFNYDKSYTIVMRTDGKTCMMKIDGMLKRSHVLDMPVTDAFAASLPKLQHANDDFIRVRSLQ